MIISQKMIILHINSTNSTHKMNNITTTTQQLIDTINPSFNSTGGSCVHDISKMQHQLGVPVDKCKLCAGTNGWAFVNCNACDKEMSQCGSYFFNEVYYLDEKEDENSRCVYDRPDCILCDECFCDFAQKTVQSSQTDCTSVDEYINRIGEMSRT